MRLQAVDWLPRPRGFARELLLIAGAAATYGGVRAATEGSAQAAGENGREILAVERQLGIGWEDALQTSILARDVLVTLANWVYIWGHWPVIAAVAIVLYRWNRPGYCLLRDAMFISGAIGFLFFTLLPVAPPRLLDVGLTDTVLERSTAYRALQPPRAHESVRGVPQPPSSGSSMSSCGTRRVPSADRFVVVQEHLRDELLRPIVWHHRALPVVAGHVLQGVQIFPERDHRQLLACLAYAAPGVARDEARLGLDERNRDLFGEARELVGGMTWLRPGAEDADDHVQLRMGSIDHLKLANALA
jgi:hypothetical protein